MYNSVNVKESVIQQLVKEMQEKIELQNFLYAHQHRVPPPPKPLKYEFDSKDFFPDGTYKHYSSIKKSLSKWLAKKVMQVPKASVSVPPRDASLNADVSALRSSRNQTELRTDNKDALPEIKR